MTLGQKLKKLRIEKRYTQKELADKLHVTFQTVSKREGDTNEPDISTLKELARIFECSFDFLLSDDEESKEEIIKEEPVLQETETENKQVIKLHICTHCGKEIPVEEEVVKEEKRTALRGNTLRIIKVGEKYYHKKCLQEIKKKENEAKLIEQGKNLIKVKWKCFGWSIAGGVVALAIMLAYFMCSLDIYNPWLGVLYSLIAGYAIFSMIYCIISGSYLGEFFMRCAGLTVKFPVLIFSRSFDGLAWLIGMKLLFAVLGFLIGLLALLIAIILSAILGAFSFPFVLIRNIKTSYADAF